MLELILGWPPSVNSYWLSAANGRHKYIGRKGIEYRADVFSRVYEHQGAFSEGLLDVSIKAYPPDKRVRDLDNVLKALLDSLSNVKIFTDDFQVNRLLIERFEVKKGGELRVTIKPYELIGNKNE